MKKMRKIFAVLLTLAMVLAMSIPTFAAEVTEPVTSYSSKITVTGLSSQEEETVNLYAAITLNVDKNEWIVADWAKDYIGLSTDGKKYEITNAEGLAKAVPETIAPFQQKHVVGETQVEFSEVPVGAYVVTASGNKITYSPMVAETYNDVATYMQAKNVTLVAKSSGYDVKKEAADGFVKRGEEVTFTITTTFPSFTVADSEDNTFKIIDTPTIPPSIILLGAKNVSMAKPAVKAPKVKKNPFLIIEKTFLANSLTSINSSFISLFYLHFYVW